MTVDVKYLLSVDPDPEQRREHQVGGGLRQELGCGHLAGGEAQVSTVEVNRWCTLNSSDELM